MLQKERERERIGRKPNYNLRFHSSTRVIVGDMMVERHTAHTIAAETHRTVAWTRTISLSTLTLALSGPGGFDGGEGQERAKRAKSVWQFNLGRVARSHELLWRQHSLLLAATRSRPFKSARTRSHPYARSSRNAHECAKTPKPGNAGAARVAGLSRWRIMCGAHEAQQKHVCGGACGGSPGGTARRARRRSRFLLTP